MSAAPADVQIRPLRTPSDRNAVLDLIRTGFELKPGLGDAFAHLFENLLDADPAVTPGCVRLALRDERVVGHVLVAPRAFDIHGHPVSGAQLAMLTVAPGHRGEGIAAALLQDAGRSAAAGGACILHLSGDPRYYLQHGYMPAYCRSTAVLDLIPPDGPGETLRPAQLGDAPKLAALSANHVPPGSVAPSVERWSWLLSTGHPAGLLSRNDAHFGFCADEDSVLIQGEAASPNGFARVGRSGNRAVVYEAGVAPDSDAGSLVASLIRWLLDAGVAHCGCHLPVGSPLLDHADNVVTSEDPERVARLLDPEAALRGILPLLQERALKSAPGQSLLITCDTHPLLHLASDGVLTLSPDGVSSDWAITLPPGAVLRALVGTDRLAERLASRPGASSELLALADALFPAGGPSFHLADSI